MISGDTKLIAHIGVPTESFRAPMIYNPWFEARGIDTVVVPMASCWRTPARADGASSRPLSPLPSKDEYEKAS